MVAAVNIGHAIDESNIAEKPEAKCRILLMYFVVVRETSREYLGFWVKRGERTHERVVGIRCFFLIFWQRNIFGWRAQPTTNTQHICHTRVTRPLNCQILRTSSATSPQNLLRLFLLLLLDPPLLTSTKSQKSDGTASIGLDCQRGFPWNAWASSCQRFRATYPFATNFITSTVPFFGKFTIWSTSLTIILQECLPFFTKSGFSRFHPPVL